MTDLRNRQTILVVDDEPANIELLRNVLSEHYRVKVATNGEAALRQAYSDAPPDLILLDVMMPGMSGHEVCQRLKANPDRRKIPVIFVTAMNSLDDERLGLELGAVDYITKPLSPAIVEARVRTHLALYDQTREMERMVAQRTAELKLSRTQIIRRLGRAAEFKDNETGNHVLRMSQYARLIGMRVGVSGVALDILTDTATMHDIGKLGIPDHILCKPGKLDPSEWEVMRTHPAIGADIIGEHEDDLLATARVIALTHHEKWDGSGYPAGLAGEDIPLLGRIVALADVLDALLSARPYKPPFSMAQTMAYITEQAGGHFDPDLVKVLVDALPEVERIARNFADDRGALTDLEIAETV
ncbi:MAG: response regulator [Rhodocyclaceae bacterium]|jgi:putative two-component system response regulator|nr:response regulator [Rhodocyclaceae bacterium]MBK6909023.1 response regulator [Rhodocyclaceae bacterium]